MALTPIDVQQKTFGTALRGYDLDEVDDFLDQVVTSLNGYEQRLSEQEENITALRIELENKGNDESAISRALVTAQRSADSILENAKAEAAQLVSEARVEVVGMYAARDDERKRLNTEVTAMRAGVAELRQKIQDMTESFTSEMDEVDLIISHAGSGLAEGEPEPAPPESHADIGGDATPQPLATALPWAEQEFPDPTATVEDVWLGETGRGDVRDLSTDTTDLPDREPVSTTRVGLEDLATGDLDPEGDRDDTNEALAQPGRSVWADDDDDTDSPKRPWE